MTKKLTWVLAHEPYELFLKAAKVFSNDINQGTNGRYQIEVVGLSEYNNRTSEKLTTHATDREKIVNLVDSGMIDMATVYVNTLGKIDNRLWSLSMPFIFEDHEHASRVIDGSVGKELFAGLGSNSNIHGLAFTYSGGFRMIPSVKAIESLEDFYELTIRTGQNPVAQDTFLSVHAKPVGMLIDDFRNAMNSAAVQAGETTYPRFFSMGHHEQAKYINHTEHSLFLTSIVMNSKLWNEMSGEDQSIFAEAAIKAAKIEREESLADVNRVQQEAAKLNIPTVKMTAKERNRFQTATKSIYSKYDSLFGNDLINRIIKG